MEMGNVLPSFRRAMYSLSAPVFPGPEQGVEKNPQPVPGPLGQSSAGYSVRAVSPRKYT